METHDYYVTFASGTGADEDFGAALAGPVEGLGEIRDFLVFPSIALSYLRDGGIAQPLS